jgi:hypothetical protein
MSTIAPMPPMASVPSCVEWRLLNRKLWVGRRDGRPVGTVEHGRRYLALGIDGETIGAYRTLEEAQAAVAAPERRQQAEPQHVRRSWTGVTFVALLSLSTAALLGIYAFLGL